MDYLKISKQILNITLDDTDRDSVILWYIDVATAVVNKEVWIYVSGLTEIPVQYHQLIIFYTNYLLMNANMVSFSGGEPKPLPKTFDYLIDQLREFNSF